MKIDHLAKIFILNQISGCPSSQKKRLFVLHRNVVTCNINNSIKCKQELFKCL